MLKTQVCLERTGRVDQEAEMAKKNFETLKSCPVCGSNSLTFFRKATFEYTSLQKDQMKITDSEYGKIWHLDQCKNCSHVFANPYPRPSFIQSLYSQVEDPLYEEEAEGRANNFKPILVNLEKLIPDKGPLLDVGAATGILMNLARRWGWQPEGVEPSSWAVDTAKEKYGLDILRGSFETAPLKKKFYSAVTMVDYIEHTPSPRQAVKKAGEILAPGGILCMVTPDINSLAARISGKTWWHLRPGHLAYFSRKSLSTLLNREGFSILKMKKYSWTFSAHYLISRKNFLSFLLKNRGLASLWKKIPIKLALGDSTEVYARRESKP